MNLIVFLGCVFVVVGLLYNAGSWMRRQTRKLTSDPQTGDAARALIHLLLSALLALVAALLLWPLLAGTVPYRHVALANLIVIWLVLRPHFHPQP